MAEVTLALDCRAVLGESPVGLPDGRVLFADINAKKVLGYDSVAGKALPEVSTAQMVGCIVPRASGGLLAGLEDRIVHIPSYDTEDSSAHSLVAMLPEHLRGPSKRCNDGKCDPQGRFWVGTMHFSWRDESAPPGGLLCLPAQPGAQLEERVAGTRLANGLAWSADSSRMFFVDSALGVVDCFNFDAATGGVANRRTVIKFVDEPGVPDGMAIDAGGKLWVVIGESGSVRQMDPETGKEVSRVLLPVHRPTSCAFGGKDLSELYVTTREEPEKCVPKGSSPHPNAGGLFKARIPGVKGPDFAFAYKG